MTDQAPQRTRLTKSKATASMSAIQTLEITTTAIVTGSTMDSMNNSPPLTIKEEELQRKHHHYHHIRSPTFNHSDFNSPLPSPPFTDVVTPISLELTLPPPLTKGPSEAIVALQDAVNESNKKPTKKCLTTTPELQLFESSFFSSILLIQWSNLIGPKVEKVWSVEPLEEKIQMLIGRQVLNGEMGREFQGVEPKWVILHRQAIICTAFLFHDPTLDSLCALIFVVPIRYLRNFSRYFQVLCNRVPVQLVEPLLQLRKVYNRYDTTWPITLKYFTIEKIVPFVKSVMDLESVSLPLSCIKTSHTILNYESRHTLDSPFIAKVITSHLQTFGSTLLVGNTLANMNMVINTLALFLTAEEKSRSSHARKNHHYTPNLYIQGLLLQDMEEMETRIELAVLDSTFPTTLVDMTRSIVKKTPLFHKFNHLKSKYRKAVLSKLEDNLFNFIYETTNTPSNLNDWSKRQQVFEKTENIAPMVQNLLDECCRIPPRLRESYVKQWRRWLVKKALSLIKFIEVESPFIMSQPEDNDLITHIKNALSLYNKEDFTIVLIQAEKLKPGIADFIITDSSKKL